MDMAAAAAAAFKFPRLAPADATNLICECERKRGAVEDDPTTACGGAGERVWGVERDSSRGTGTYLAY